jgi:phosphoglycerate dehydrogenase-like enzyme
MPTVLIAPSTLAGIEAPYLQVLREAGLEPLFPARQAQLTEDELLDVVPRLVASIAGSEPYTRRVLAAAPHLRVIARAGVGHDAVDLAAATDYGVAVTITPGTNHDAVAEQTMAMILALAKNLVALHQAVKQGQWPRQASLPLRGRTLGIAGLGRIGKAVAVRGVCFGMRVLAYEPYPDSAFVARHQVTLVPFERLLAESDYLTLHVPLSLESQYLMNRRTLSLMKPTAFLINTARGGLVNEADLFEALQARRLAGAALDVFEREPPGSSPLFDLENVLLLPHTAGVDLQSRDDMALSAARAIVALSRGEWPAEQVVNPDVRAKFHW